MISRLLQGFGLGLLFVPITVSAYSRIPKHLTGQATGLFNLMRNEGGSVGIALSTTILSQRSQFHQNRLVENLSNYSADFLEKVNSGTHYLFIYGGFDPSSSTYGAYGLFYKELLRQSYLKAFIDVFHFLMLIFLLLIPFVFLLKGKVKKDGIIAHN